MSWIVLGEKNGKISLVSKGNITGILPKGSFITLEQGNAKFILRIEDSLQSESYSPEPLVIDMDLTPLEQDRKCRNIIIAYRVYEVNNRNDGLIDYIKPQSVARRSNQEEIDLALGGLKDGPRVFVATIQYNQNQLLSDESGKYITASLPNDMFFHQMLICGKTGSGKTVATKYLSQYFVEELNGAVLAINVKDVDLLKMDQASKTSNENIKKEWNGLGKEAHGINNYRIYYPANSKISATKKINNEICEKITLDVKEIDPESLTGLLTKISDIASMNLPNIFRWWQEDQDEEDYDDFKFSNFIKYFKKGAEDKYFFNTLNTKGEESTIILHRGTYDNILRSLDVATDFFDNEDAKVLKEDDILFPGKMSVIDITDKKNGVQFGSILLRDLLHRIVEAKSELRSEVPVLIIIDEVHMFYNTDASYEALGELDTICRTGRSQKIGVIFSSQNPQDIPKGLSSVINTKIFFKSDIGESRKFGVSLSDQEIENLKKGFAVVSIHDLSQLKIVKFPLAFCGVFE